MSLPSISPPVVTIEQLKRAQPTSGPPACICQLRLLRICHVLKCCQLQGHGCGCDKKSSSSGTVATQSGVIIEGAASSCSIPKWFICKCPSHVPQPIKSPPSPCINLSILFPDPACYRSDDLECNHSALTASLQAHVWRCLWCLAWDDARLVASGTRCSWQTSDWN